MSAGWFFLAAMIGMYGVANLLQSVAAAKTTAHETLDPKLLVKLVRHRTYVAGLLCQILGFALAFLARADLPLFLVQSSVAAGLGVTAVLGVLVLKWRLPKLEIALLVALCAGLAGLVVSAEPHPSHPLNIAGIIGLLIVLGLLAVGGFFTARLQGVPGSVALGALAGIAFGAAAVASRPLANIGSFATFITDPLLYLLIAHSVVGQLLLGLAMQRGSTTAAVAAMDAAAAVPAAIVGLLFLGDKIAPGREWLAGLGFLVTLAAVIGLTFFAEPQHHHQISGRHRQLDPAHAGLHTARRVRRRLALSKTAGARAVAAKAAGARAIVAKAAGTKAVVAKTGAAARAKTPAAAAKTPAAKTPAAKTPAAKSSAAKAVAAKAKAGVNKAASKASAAKAGGSATRRAAAR